MQAIGRLQPAKAETKTKAKAKTKTKAKAKAKAKTVPTAAGRPTGLRLIIGYKLLKSALQLGAAAFLLYGARHGLAAELAAFADRTREHAVHAWSNLVASALRGLLGGPHPLTLAAAALAGDAVVSSFEAWVLARGYRWGGYMVVVATASLLPFEIVALVHHVRLGRVAILLLNAAVVAYLLRRARLDRAPG